MADESDDTADSTLTEALAPVWMAYQQADALRGAKLARAVVDAHADHGEAWFALACCIERRGDLLEADRCFARASRCRVDPQPLPYRVGWPRFQRLIDEAGRALPERLKAVLGEVTLVLADYAEPELIEHHGEPELLGLFAGVERGDRLSPAPGSISPRIYVFRRAHEHNSSNARELADEVKQTLYHELGHYIGYDEDGLDELGMG